MVNVIDLLLSRGAIGRGKDGWEIRVPMEKLVLDIPQNVQDIVERQFSRATPEERELLSAAGIVGPEFSTDVLAAALGMDWEVSRVEECCQDLARRGRWLVSCDPGHETYRFIHEFHQRTLCRMLPSSRRAEFHLRIAEFLERQSRSSHNDLAFDLATAFRRRSFVFTSPAEFCSLRANLGEAARHR
jgi:predicted ATPase